MELHYIRLRKDQLDSIPEVERTLLVLLVHAANELSVLGKAFHFAVKDPGDDPILIEARNAQALTYGRILSGKIFECWQLLRSAFFQTQLSKEYEPLLDDQGREALSSLKKYFGRKNIIEAVRNKLAFHYAPEQIQQGYASLVEGDVLDVYLAEKNANTLYVFAETIAGRALMQLISPSDHSRALAALIDETSAPMRTGTSTHGLFRTSGGGRPYEQPGKRFGGRMSRRFRSPWMASLRSRIAPKLGDDRRIHCQ